MDYSEIVKVVETTSSDDVNKYLATKRWCVLSVSSGRMEDGTAYHLYSLGWYGPLDPDNPEDNDSEFPVATPKYGWD